MSKQPTIGGEPVNLPDFSAFKAIHAMDIVGEVESAWRQVLDGAATFERDYMTKHAIKLSRAEARRQYRPKPLYRARNVVGDDDRVTEVIEEPVLEEDGKTPVLGADPLAHLTDQDWQASANELVIPEKPSPDLVLGAMVPSAFKLGRAQVLRLLALALTTNRQLEEWDGEVDINSKLDEEGKALLHRAKAEELVQLAVAVAEKCKEQLGGPFEEAAQAFRELWPSKTEDDETTPGEPTPMEVETESSGSRPGSSTESEDDTAGTQESSSTMSATDG